MLSSSGRFALTFNGEIYNHRDLRELLSTTNPYQHTNSWRGHSDSETLLACIEAWGLEKTLQKTVGMFAIALWDTQTHTLHLARDRFGEKPLYYGWVKTKSSSESAFVFGSELKALCAYPGFSNQVSREALALYMRFTYVPAPHSIYQNIYKLEPGCMLSLDTKINLDRAQGGKLPDVTHVPNVLSAPPRPTFEQSGLRMHRWWSLASVVEIGAEKQISDEEEAIKSLEQQAAKW